VARIARPKDGGRGIESSSCSLLPFFLRQASFLRDSRASRLASEARYQEYYLEYQEYLKVRRQ
jgi:hypothetical protein